MSSPCNTPDCGCVDCVEIPPVPPCTTCDCNPGFCDDGCEEYTSTKCFVYSGDVLPCLNILPGDSMNAVLAKVDESYCRVSGEGGTDKWVKTSATDQVSNYLINKIDVDNSSVRIENTNVGADEKLTFNFDQEFKVKTDGSDREDYLINKIILKPDPLGLVIPQDITVVNGKVAIGFTLDMATLCSMLHNSGCIPAEESCPILMQGLRLNPSENGNLDVEVLFIGPPALVTLFEYTLDGSQTFYSSTSKFTVHGLSAGLHTFGVKAICTNRKASIGIAQDFVVPEIQVICPSFSVTATDTSVAVAWSTLPNYTYNAQIALSEFGAPFQSAAEVNGTHVFTSLSAAQTYWVRIVPTYLGITKSVCSSSLVTTTSQSCTATVSNITVSNPASDGTVTLSWFGTGQSYEYRVGTGAWVATTATSASLANQSIGSHTFFVRSKCANGLYGGQSNADFVIPSIQCNAAVTAININNPSDDGTVNISWTSTGAASFEYKLGTSGTWVPTTASSLDLTGQSAGLHIIYVRPLCPNQLYGSGNSSNFTIPTPVCNAAINNLSLDSANSAGNVTISWTGASSAALYEYQVGAGSWIATTATSVNLTGIANGTTISVRAKCGNGLYGNTSTMSITIPAVVCAAPGTPTLTDTVTLTFIAEWTFTDSDPYAAIAAGTSTLTYPHSAAIALGSDVVCAYGAEGNNKFLVQRVQANEAAKSQWFNTPFNYGTFPDSVYYAVLNRGGYNYYITRDTFTFDSTSFSVTLKS